MEAEDCHHLIEQSAELRARSGETHQVSAEIIATSKELAAQTAQLLEVTVSIRADAHGARGGPPRAFGAWLLAWPRRQALGAGSVSRVKGPARRGRGRKERP